MVTESTAVENILISSINISVFKNLIIISVISWDYRRWWCNKNNVPFYRVSELYYKRIEKVW